mgnify:CR=1 FL=1
MALAFLQDLPHYTAEVLQSTLPIVGVFVLFQALTRSFQRGVYVFGAALVISYVTFFMVNVLNFPSDMLIWFGILHLLGVCMMLFPLFKRLPVWALAVLGVGAALLCTSAATLNACGQTLKEWAAQLLLPKAPKAGKRIFLERITPVWKRMKFTHKVTARNLFRYKKRFFMTVIGVAGCTALLVTGFGLKDSISDIVSKQFGKVFTYDELKIIADLAEKYDVYVITDEVYEHIVYAPNKHTYFASLPGMWKRTLSCSSLSKTYSITGWRLGYIIAPPEIIETAKKVHDFLTVGAAAPLQEAAVTGLHMPDSYYQWLQDKYTHKRNLFLKGLEDIGIPHTDPQGAYYILLDISEFGFDSDLEFCEVLARDVGVGAVPGSSFFREPVNHLIRLHFAKKDETLNEALNRLQDIRKKIPVRK